MGRGSLLPMRAALGLVVLAACLQAGSGATLTISTAASAVSYTEQAAAVAVDGALVLDSDDSALNVVSATMRLTTTDEFDLLEFGETPWFPSTYTPYSSATGLLTITGSTNFKAYKIWLQGVTFKNMNDRPKSGTRSVSFTACKAENDCVTATRTIAFTPVNDKPVVAVSAAFSYTEMSGKRNVDDALTVTDPDTDTLTQATVQISAGFDTGKDALSCAVDPSTLKDAGGVSYGLSQSWNAATGTLTVATAGSAPVSVWQTVLRGVQYENPSQNPSPASRKFTFKVYDGAAWSDASTRDMTFIIINEIPVLTLSQTLLTYNETDAPLAVRYLGLDAGLTVSDVDTPSMTGATVKVAVGFETTKDYLRFTPTATITGSFDAATGVLTMTGTGTPLAYQSVLRTVEYYNAAPNAAAGTRQIEFNVTDSEGGTSSAVLLGVKFVPENDAPEMQVVVTPVEWVRSTVNLQSTLNLTDKDDVTLSRATVTLLGGGGFSPPVDSLTATKTAGVHDAIQVSYDPLLGILTLSGPGSPAAYQSLLRTVNLVQTSAANTMSRTIEFEVIDGAGASTGKFNRRYYNSDHLAKPTLTSITTIGTIGGTITITGTAFGPITPNLVDKVGLASRTGFRLCLNPRVIVEDTKIECTAPGGSGKDLGAFVEIAAKFSLNFPVFSYLPPTVTSIGNVGTLGGSTIITGTNFGLAGEGELTQAANGADGTFGVSIGGKECAKATVMDDTGTKINCTVAQFVGKALNVNVCVTRQCSTGGNGLFNYNAPTLTSSFKASLFGYYAYITGTNFGPIGVTSSVSVQFKAAGGTAFVCTSTEVTIASTEIKCMMRAMQDAAGANTNDVAKTYTVTVAVGNQQVAGAGLFSYELPVITGATTTSLYGGQVTITGRNFGGVGLVPTLQARDASTGSTFNVGTANTPAGQAAPAVTTLHTTATSWIPAYTTGSLKTVTPELYVTIGGYKSSTAFTNYTYEGPVVTGVSSAGGSQFGDCITATNAAACTETVTITGRNFGPTVGFSDWWLSHLNFKKDVTETIAPIFSEKYARIEIDGKLPCANAACTTRSNWGMAAEANTGNSIQTIKVISDTQMTFTRTAARPAAHLTGQALSVKVYLYCYGTALTTCQHSGTTGNGIFNYIGPVVSGFDAATAPDSNGGVITITGLRFGAPYAANAGYFTTATYPAAGIAICSRTTSCDDKVYCTNPEVLSDTQVKCTVSAATMTTGISMKTLINVTLGTFNSGTTGAGLFTYGIPKVNIGLTAPAIGGQLTITGSGFGPAGYQAYVFVSVGPFSRACTNVVVVSHTQITCTQSAGTGASLDVNVTVTSKDGGALGTAASNAAFSYSKPTVTSVTSCLTSGGSVGVYGTNFGNIKRGQGGADSVNIGTLAMTGITVYNDTYLEGYFAGNGPFATAPPHEVVVVIDAQTSSSTGKFYFTSPNVTGIAKRPKWLGTDTVQITGTSFGVAGTSQAANTLAATISGADVAVSGCAVSVAHTEITCTTVCVTVCKTLATGTTHLNYRDIVVQVGLPIATGNANAGTRLTSGTTGNAKLKFVGPVIQNVIGATSTTVNQLSFFPASDQLKVTGLNFGLIDATDGSTLNFVGVCSKSPVSTCVPYPFVIANNNYGDFGTPVQTPVKSIDNTELSTFISARYGSGFSVMVQIAGVTSDDAENTGVKVGAVTAVGNGILSFVGPEINDVGAGHAILTDGTQAMAAKTQVQVSAKRLGPVGATNIREVRWAHSTNPTFFGFLANSNAAVTVLDTAIKFDVPEGVGTATFYIVMNNGIGDMSSATASFTYTAPAIVTVSDVAAGGGTVTITGTSFGPAGSSHLKDLLLGSVSCMSANVTIAHTQITCTMPAGVGASKDVNFKIGGLVATGGTAKFSYKQPVLTSVQTIATNHKISPSAVINASYPSIGDAPWMLLTGTHFGPLGTAYEYIRLAYDLSGAHAITDTGYTNCTNIQVTIADTQIQCLLGSSTLGSGSGKNYDVLMKLPDGPTNGPAPGSNSYADKFSYALPTVTSATSTTYFGGVTTTITGTNFGCLSSSYSSNACKLPTGSNQVVSVLIGGKTCASPNVSVAHTQILCNTPDMTGNGIAYQNIPLVLTVEGQTTLVAATYTYAGPLITTISEASMFGGWITVTGTSFGPVGDCSGSLAGCNIERIWISGASLDVVTAKAAVTVAGTEMKFYAPASVQTETMLNLTLTIAGKETGTTGYQKFIYRGPFITAVVGGTTAGGTTTITGRNFGPVGVTVQSLVIKGDNNVEEVCTNAQVIVENTIITCTSIGGSGTGKDVTLTIGGAHSGTSGNGLFNYAPAEVTLADPDFSRAGTVVTFTGTSFGADVTKIKAYVDNIECTTVTLVQPHYKVSCKVPKSSGGLRPVRIDVDGVIGNALPVYSYPLPEVTIIGATIPSRGSPPPLTIYGNNFGELYSILATVNDTQSPQIENVTIGGALCSTPKVIVDDRVITCNVPKSLAKNYGGSFNLADWNHTAGSNMTIVVSLVGGQSSGQTGRNKFAFNQPTITNIQPRNGKKGDVIVVSGRDLGDSGQAIELYINGRPSPQVDFITAESAFKFVVPVGTALNNEVIIKINGRNATYSGIPALFNFDIPTLDPAGTIPPSTTRGGASTTLTGTGFGPVGNAHVSSVNIFGVGACLNPNVTVEDTELTCITGSGQGGAINTTVTVDGLTSLPTPAFSFHVPIVTSVQIQSNKTILRQGDLIFIRGKNFGNDADKITVRIKGDLDKPGFGVVCPLTGDKLTFLEKPFEKPSVTCIAPLMVGKEVSVIVDAAGLENVNADTLNRVTYASPVVDTASSAKTNGGEAAGMVTITGTNFGPAGAMYSQYFTSIFLGGVPCNQPVVIDTYNNNTNNTIQCQPAGGVGKELDVFVTMNNAGSGISGTKKFSFLPPSVTRIDPPPTIGGIVTVYGENFGPAGTFAKALVYTDQTCPAGVIASSFAGASGCTPVAGIGTPSAVTVVDHETITFTFPPGVGGSYDLLIEVGNQTSGISGDNKFSYHVPVVQTSLPAIQPPTLPISATLITITGTNFGTVASAIKVSVGGRFTQSQIKLYTGRNTDGTVTGVSEIIVNVPFNAGNNLPVQVHVGAMSSVPSTAAVKTDVFSYNTPVVNYTTPVPTQGSAASDVPLSIYGYNFGPVGNVSQVIVGDADCTNAKVTVQDSTITCQQPAGMGKDLDVFVRISPTDDTSSQSTGLKKFSYAAPIVDNINPTSAKVGDFVTVTGRNFGFTQELIRFCVVGPDDVNWCNDYNEMQKQHTKFYAKVPVGFGSNRALRIEVKGLMGVKTTSIVFSYQGPQVKSAVDVPTAGGVLRVIGKEFGPTNSSAFDSVIVRDSKNRIVPCLTPRVVVADTAVECDLPAGSGKGLEVQVSVGGQKSNWERVFSYAAPVITNIQPAVAAVGDTVTVTGLNFGVNSSEISLGMIKNIAGGGGAYAIPLVSANASITMVSPHTKFSFVIPLGAGPELTLLTSLPIYGADTTFMRTSTSAQSGNGFSTTFSYKPPVVSAVSSVSTAGGVATVTGSNFGPVGSALVNAIIMGEGATTLVCSDGKVTVSNTQATCQLGSGSGFGYKVTMVIFNQTNVDATRFAYAVPVVESVQPSQAAPGAVVTVSGKNFGVIDTDISVKFGGYDCKDVAKLTDHTQLTCTVPDAQGKALPAVATVKGLSGSRVGASQFTFTKSGCTSETAINYDGNATTNDGTCKILGCMKLESYNYNPIANEDSGACEQFPVTVSMRVKADFSEFLATPTVFKDKFSNEVAKNLNISKSRINITNVAAGSIIFTFQIFDDGTAGAVSVQDAKGKLEQQVLSNSWESEFVLLSVEVVGSDAGVITTKANEPAVSTASIVGVGIGFGLIVVWLLCWRRCMTAIAARCFAARDDDDLMEVQIYKNPVAQAALPPAYAKYGKLGS